MNELTWNWKSGEKNNQFFTFLCGQLLDDDVVDIWNRALATVSCTFFRPHLQKVVLTLQIFTIFVWNQALATSLVRILSTSSWKSGPTPSVFYVFVWSTTWWRCGWHMKSSSRYSLVHIFSTSSSKSGPNPSDFYDFCVKPSSRYKSRAHFVDLIFKKWSEPRQCFDDFYAINYLMTMWSTDEMKLSLQSRAHSVDLIVDLIFKKRSETVSFFYDFYVKSSKSSSRYSLVHILSTSSSKSGPTPSDFWRFLCDQLLDDDLVDRWNEALVTVARTLCRPHCRPHLQKVVWDRQFFRIFMWNRANRALATVSCTFCRPFSGSRPRNRRKQTPSSGDHRRPLYPKKTAFSAVNSRVPDRDWDDVIDMMMWLTYWLRWWCGCHDGETASHWQSSVTPKFPH